MIPVFRPKYGVEELQAVQDALQSGWTGLGPRTREFEQAFSNYLGKGFVVGTNSCTSALHLALILHGVSPGDEVLVPALNFVSCANMIVQCGATPVWVDVDSNTLCANPDDIGRKITTKTKAIVVVHYGGTPCNMDEIQRVAGDIPIIEDAAHACGATYRNKKIGSSNNTTCFSFHAVKNLSMGEGGAIVVQSKEYYERLRSLRWLGIDQSTIDRVVNKNYVWNYAVKEQGWKYHLSDISAAIGLVQLGKLDRGNQRRRDIARRYREGLANIRAVYTRSDPEGVVSAQHLFVGQVDPNLRGGLMDFLAGRGIGTSVHYIPTYQHPAYATTDPRCPTTDLMARSIFSLPMHLHLTDEDVDTILSALHDWDKGIKQSHGC